MKSMYERLRTLKPRDLRRVSEAIDIELRRRMAARKATPDGNDQEAEMPVLPLPLASRSPGPRLRRVVVHVDSFGGLRRRCWFAQQWRFAAAVLRPGGVPCQ